MEELKRFTCDARFEIIEEPVLVNGEDSGETSKKYRIVAMIGDKFMNGGFFPEKESKRVYKQWQGTLHDINHFGTHYPNGFFPVTNVLWFIGYHDNVKHNSKTKEITMDIQVNHNTMYADAWKAYIETCELAGQIPNVSVTYLGKQEWVLAKNLPKEANWKAEGYNKDDLVPVITEVEPVCVSTVLRGRCNDKDGCGVRKDSCSDDTCGLKGGQEVTDALEKERQEIIERIKSKEEKLDD